VDSNGKGHSWELDGNLKLVPISPTHLWNTQPPDRCDGAEGDGTSALKSGTTGRGTAGEERLRKGTRTGNVDSRLKSTKFPFSAVTQLLKR